MVAGWFIAGVAFADVHVDDPRRCVDAEAVEEELQFSLGSDLMDRVDLRVRLSGADHWRLELDVLDGQGSLWNRAVNVEPVDCPYLSALVVQSVERGLADLPGWDLGFRRRPAELGFFLSGTVPLAMRAAAGFDLWIPLGRRIRWSVQPDLVYGLADDVGIGTARFAGATLSTGLGVDLPVGKGAFRMVSRIGGGGVFFWGTAPGGNNGNYRLPRAVVTTDLGAAFAAALRMSVRFEVPVLRMDYYVGDNVGDTSVPEPPVRVGVVIELAGVLRRSDVPRSERP